MKYDCSGDHGPRQRASTGFVYPSGDTGEPGQLQRRGGDTRFCHLLFSKHALAPLFYFTELGYNGFTSTTPSTATSTIVISMPSVSFQLPEDFSELVWALVACDGSKGSLQLHNEELTARLQALSLVTQTEQNTYFGTEALRTMIQVDGEEFVTALVREHMSDRPSMVETDALPPLAPAVPVPLVEPALSVEQLASLTEARRLYDEAESLRKRAAEKVLPLVNWAKQNASPSSLTVIGSLVPEVNVLSFA